MAGAPAGGLAAGAGSSAAGPADDVRRRLPWLWCSDMVALAHQLATADPCLRSAPLLQMLGVLERGSQLFHSEEMATEAWLLQIQEKLHGGAVEAAVRDLAGKAACSSSATDGRFVGALWSLVTARAEGACAVPAALAASVGDLGAGSPAELVRLAAGLAAAAGLVGGAGGARPLQQPALAARLAARLRPALAQLP
ncbi:unnamed protein product, partial [Prorocentrum cordatum]